MDCSRGYPGEWSVRQFGAAIKHTDYRTVVVSDDFIIKPIDGFGNPEMLRVALATEKPDVVLLFTDPRFFIWLFEMSDEIRQVCPIAWWHVWDNYPYPDFNDVLYDSTDLINCHSYMTYEMIKQRHPDKTNFIPHGLPSNLYFPIGEKEKDDFKIKILGKNRKDHFVGIWVNRNAKRKRPADVLWSWKIFLENLRKKHGHQKATLIMHCDPNDTEGPNLLRVSEMLSVNKNVFFSKERLDFDKMNILYNVSDFCLNISYAEGFGLPTLEAMQTGTPIIALKTGGLTRQAVDHRDGSENGVALDVEFKSIVGSQQVPFIFEDYVSTNSVANGIMRLFELDENKRKALKEKVRNYAQSEFAHSKTIDEWHNTLSSLCENWEKNKKLWNIKTF